MKKIILIITILIFLCLNGYCSSDVIFFNVYGIPKSYGKLISVNKGMGGKYVFWFTNTKNEITAITGELIKANNDTPLTIMFEDCTEPIPRNNSK